MTHSNRRLDVECILTHTLVGDPLRVAVIRVDEQLSTRSVIRKAKRALGVRGRHIKTDYGDSLRLNLSGSDTMILIDRGLRSID